MRKLSFFLVAAGILTLAAKAPKDPILMEVDGRPVTLSEFEYFYHKNDGNEIEKETPEQYLQRFIDYKLKVAQARAERRDTTEDYRKDFRSFRREMAAPYLTDSATYNKLLEESYGHMLSNRKIDHLMLASTNRALADSLRQVLINGGDFEAIVAAYSIDPSKTQNNGHYDWISGGQFPYEFEEAVYNTPIGQWSDVITTNYGFHIVKPLAERPASGEVHAAHILVKLDEGGDSAAAKARIDSISALLKNGGNFELLARTNSDCPSKKKDGDLGFFSRGQMVPEFEEVAFTMANGDVSEPFLSRFGWHIVKKYEERTRPENEVKERIKMMMKQDSRQARPRIARAEQLRKEYNVRIDQAGHDKLLNAVNELGFDSAKVVLAGEKMPLYFVADSATSVSEFVNSLSRLAPGQLDNALESRLNAAALSYEDARLEQKYPEFRRQSEEYAEGLMLVSSLEDNVWNMPTRNPEALKAYFEANKAKYAFDEPRWKGYVIYTTSDSLLSEIKTYLNDVKPSSEVLGDSLKTRFPREVRIERIVLPKGENQIVDYIAFGGPKPEFSNRYKFFTTYMAHMINGPEEVADVRNRVTNDYTRELEEKFVSDLHKKYPVKVNKKILKKVK